MLQHGHTTSATGILREATGTLGTGSRLLLRYGAVLKVRPWSRLCGVLSGSRIAPPTHSAASRVRWQLSGHYAN